MQVIYFFHFLLEPRKYNAAKFIFFARTAKLKCCKMQFWPKKPRNFHAAKFSCNKVDNNYQPNFKQKIIESLFKRQLEPLPNVNEQSILLRIFNRFITVIILIQASFHWFVPFLNTVQ